jgi:amidase
MPGDLNTLDATALLQALDGRRISALELLEASAARAHQLKTRINAVVTEDLEPARRRAREIDEQRAKGETSATLGMLAGLPMTIKDCLDVDGMPASAGLKHFLDRPAADAFAVGHVRSEGAVIWGKTNVPVMAGDWQSCNDLYGQTNNPWDEERTPGGSSGGAAAALATGITALELGSDIGGSLRIPASFCGVYAHKPTYGLVSTRGHVPPAPGAAAEPDHGVVGPMARSARDLRLLLSILAGGTIAARAQPMALAGVKVGLWLDDPAFILDAEVRSVIENLSSDLISEGVVVEPIQSPVDGQHLLDTYLALLMPIIAAGFPPAQYRSMKAIRPLARMAMSTGRRPTWALQVLNATISHREWLAANEAREQMVRDLKPLFERFEVIIAPVAPITAFPHDHSAFVRRTLRCSDNRKIPYDSMLRWIALATACGLPATAIPAGLSIEGLPIGVQIIGPRGGDSKTLAVAEAIESRLGGFRAPPPSDIV